METEFDIRPAKPPGSVPDSGDGVKIYLLQLDTFPASGGEVN